MQTQSFQIIPVIDLMQGQVVHAKLGQRDHYQAIHSTICNSSAALDVVAALLKLYPFQTLYIADIDAILGRGNHDKLVESIQQNFPKLHIWLDGGNYQTSTNVMSVRGSESIKDIQTYLEYKHPHVLSLDFNAQGAMGIGELHHSVKHWPDEVICMTLNAVGGSQGVDRQRLEQILSLNQTSKIYAAGGVRGIADVQSLESMGISGALIASALHNGKISREEIAKFYAK